MVCVEISYDVLQKLREFGQSSPNREVVGCVVRDLSDDKLKLIKMENSEREGSGDYEVSPKDLARYLGETDLFIDDVDKRKYDIVAFFHTHPNNRAYPSEKDVKRFAFKKPYMIYSVVNDDFGCFFPNQAGFEICSLLVK